MGRQKRAAREESDESAYSEEEYDGEAEKTDTRYQENVLVSTPSMLNKTSDSCDEFNSQFAAFCKRTHQLHVLQRRDGDRYFLVVSVHLTEHNCRVGKTEYEQIPRHRIRLNSSELADVNTLRRVGVARKKILKYIWENTDSEPCMVDFHNLLAKLKKEEEVGSTVSERLSETHGVAHVDIDRVDNEVKQKMFTTDMARVGQVFDPVHHTTVALTRLAQMVSCYAFYVVKEQYDIAANAGTYYEVREEGNQFYAKVAVLYLRRRLNISALIPFGYIDDRWRFNSAAMLDRFLGCDYEVSGYSESNFTQDQAPLGPTQKYKNSLVQAKRIAESISQFGGRQYQRNQRILDTIACAFTEGRLDDLDFAVAQLRSGQSGNYELTEAPYRDAQSAEPAESGLETQSAAVVIQEATPTCPEAPVADGGTNIYTPFSEVNIDSEPDVVILDDHSDGDDVPATLQSVQPKSKPVHLWSVQRGLKAAGRPKITAKQRKFARRKKMTEMKKMCMERQRTELIADDSIHALAEAVYGDLLTSREWSSSLSKFKIVEGLPTVAAQPGLCIAVPVANPLKWRENAQICRVVLPRELEAKIISMLDECKSDDYGHMKVVLRDEEILLKFEVGRDTLYPKLTGDYIRAIDI
ncbi:hypothetical protein PF005_g12728 [Phytophthora fragariae]|uniref:Uncharacterized protein n=1 Tax=Phytophthora fragariae TaxID=53985 RepID=A0A6A3EU81_9STRA|nr:hypothetical protein PF009_g13935 [Phytophthora fragariae]KAE9107517.1 hypothetical protein PF007_g13012 [Phytophthora fragariae]KAE9207154.1 hypothetical protein PF005_g12728 [Phytophthora fragariae]KAE9225624.1 hypothetical protein PF004_g11877 [Phytophthora fragariae]